MTVRLIIPRQKEISERVHLAAYNLVLQEEFTIIPVDDFLFKKDAADWPKISELWIEQGYGGLRQYNGKEVWSFSSKGLAEGARLARLEVQRSWRAWLKRNALGVIVAIATSIAAVATAISAYVDITRGN